MEDGNRKMQYWIAFAVALASMTSSVSLSWTTPVIPKFHNNETSLNITDTEISWMVVATSPGMIVGTIVTRYQSDNFGRRSTVLASAVPLCLGTIFILFATNAWMIYMARFLWGIGSGMIQTVAMIYIVEIASKQIRGSLVVVNRFFFHFGGFMVISIGSFVSYQTLSYMLIVLPTAYFFACWWISETPYYLLKEGKVDAARNVLMKLNGYEDKLILEEKLTEMRKHVKEDMRRSTTAKELFLEKRYRKALIICFGMRMCQTMSGTVAIQQYLGRIMQETESSLSLSTSLMLFAALRFTVSMLSSLIVDRVGRRPLLIYSYIGAFLSFTVVGTCFYIHEVDVIKNYANLLGNIIFIGIISFNVFSTIGFDTLVFVIPAEIFPLNVKSIAMTSMNLFSSVVIFVNLKGYQIVKDLTGLYGVFWFFGAICMAGALFSYYVVPETRGKSLREIQIELQGPLYEEECREVDQTETDKAEKRLLPVSQEEKEKPCSNI